MATFPVADVSKVVLICTWCKGVMGEYDPEGAEQIRKCTNPNCIVRDESPWFDPSSRESQCLGTLRNALRGAVRETGQGDFAFKICLQFPEARLEQTSKPRPE